jgi:hypothetical protein
MRKAKILQATRPLPPFFPSLHPSATSIDIIIALQPSYTSSPIVPSPPPAQTPYPTRRAARHLHLLSAPPGLSLTHTRRRLDARDELKGGVRDTYSAYDSAKDIAQDMVVEEDCADEDVDCVLLSAVDRMSSTHRTETRKKGHVQIPRPKNENRNEA